MKKLTFLLLLAGTLAAPSLKGFANFTLLEHPQGNRVLLIGDFHLEEVSDNMVKHLQDFLTAAHRLPRHSGITSYYELEERNACHESLHDPYLAPAFRVLLAHALFHPTCPLNLQPYEPRSQISEPLNSIGTMHLNELVIACYKQSIQENFKCDPFFIKWKRTAHDINMLSLREVLTYASENLTKIRTWLQSYAPSTPQHQLFERLLQRYLASQQQLNNLFAGLNPDMPFQLAYLEIFERCQSCSELKVKVRQTTSLIMSGIDYAFADAGFLHKLLKQVPGSKTVLIAGDDHRVAIKGYLQEMGFEVRDDVATIESIDGIAYGERHMPEFGKRLQDALLLLANADGTPICYSCQKVPQKLMHCSRCKLVSYCSIACQRKDWQTHKPWCKK